MKHILLLIIIAALLCGCQNTSTQENQLASDIETENISIVETTEQNIDQTLATEETVGQEETIVETKPFVAPQKDDLVYVEDFIPNIIVDLKYATVDNFTNTIIYDSNMKAMLRYGTVEKLADAQDILNKMGYMIVIWDAYRPTEAQFKLWDVYPDSRYVANPNNGGYSSHSRGNTVDITIVRLDSSTVEMPTEFDDFSKKADRNYEDVSKIAAGHATLLQDVMEDCGFKPYSAEWWHFTDTDTYDVIKNINMVSIYDN